MEENPYVGILNVLRRDTSERQNSTWRLGVVTSVAPLMIKTGGLTLCGGELLVNYQLRTNSEAVSMTKLAGSITATTDCAKGSITKIDVTDCKLKAAGMFGGVLAPGDQVAMLQSNDQQQFIVLCKVVSA